MLQLFKKTLYFVAFSSCFVKKYVFFIVNYHFKLSLEYIVHITTSHIELVSNAFDFFYQYALRHAN